MDVLPPALKTGLHTDILNVITQGVFGRIGSYDDAFTERLNTVAPGAVKTFQRALDECGKAVDARNASVPNSTSI